MSEWQKVADLVQSMDPTVMYFAGVGPEDVERKLLSLVTEITKAKRRIEQLEAEIMMLRHPQNQMGQ